MQAAELYEGNQTNSRKKGEKVLRSITQNAKVDTGEISKKLEELNKLAKNMNDKFTKL